MSSCDGLVARKGLVVLLLTLAVALAGCSGGGLGLLGGDGPAAVDQVPAGVDTVVRVDMAITSDATTQALAEAGAESAPTAPSQPTSLAEARSDFLNETGLDPATADEMVSFQKRPEAGSLGTAQYAGVILHADWETEAVLDAIQNESTVTYEQTTYNGKTVYAPAEEPEFGSADWVAVLDDGQFVVGSEAAVKDAIDVTTGDSEAFGGDLRTAYDESRDGLVTFVTTVPQDQIPTETGAQLDTAAYRDVETVSGVYYTTSNAAGVEMQFHTASADGAADVADVTDGAISIASGYTENETAKDALRAIEVTQDGTTVTVTYEDSVDTVDELLTYLYSA